MTLVHEADPEPGVCPYCGSEDVEDLPIPLQKIVQWFCNCCGRGWTEKETQA